MITVLKWELVPSERKIEFKTGSRRDELLLLNSLLTVTIRGGSLQPKGKNFTCNVFTNFHAFPFLVW